MKLLMISGDRSVLSGKKGAFHYTLEELRTHWERIDVICPRVAGESVVPFDNVFFHPCPYPLTGQPGWIVKRGKELIAEHGHEVMTVHDYPPFYNGLGASRLKRETGVPAVSEIHHLVGFPRPASLTEAVGRLMTRFLLPGLLRRFDGVRIVNRHVGEQLVAWGVPKKKIGLVESFYLDRALIASLPPPALRYDAVFCGRMVENKGIDGVLRALKLLDGATLLLIGDGPLRGRMEALAAELGIKDRVTFAGWLPGQEDVLNAVRSARTLVMNSLSEGGPRVVLEAMACGVPCVVTRVGVMEDVIQDGVSGLFSTGRPDDLATRIGRLLKDEAFRAALAQAATAAVARFDRKVLVQEYADFLKSHA